MSLGQTQPQINESVKSFRPVIGRHSSQTPNKPQTAAQGQAVSTMFQELILPRAKTAMSKSGQPTRWEDADFDGVVHRARTGQHVKSRARAIGFLLSVGTYSRYPPPPTSSCPCRKQRNPPPPPISHRVGVGAGLGGCSGYVVAGSQHRLASSRTVQTSKAS